MALKPDQLDRHLAAGKLAPVYLIAGEEHLVVLEAADAVRAAARAQGYGEREVLESGESGFEWHELAQASQSMSLFGSRRILDLRIPTGRPGKDGAEAIVEYCDDPAPDAILLITANSWSKSHEAAWVSSVERVGELVVAWPLKREELPAFAQRRAKTRGLALTQDAVEVLVERTEGNLLATAQEIDKLALLAQGRTLDGDALEALVADTARYDAFKLSEAAFAGETARALHAVDSLRAEGDSVPGLVAVFSTQLTMLLRAAHLVERGQSAEAALRAVNVWPPSRVPAFKRALARARAPYWERRLAEAVEVERLGKGRLREFTPEMNRPGSDVVQSAAWRAFARLIGAVADPRLARAIGDPA